MKWYWGLILFAGGLLGGWAMRGGTATKEDQAGPGAPPARTARSREAPARDFPQSAKVREFMKQRGNGDLSAFYDGIPAKDRMMALELMAMQVGPDTMNHSLKSMLDRFMEKWAEQDFEEAWASATSCGNDGLRRYMTNQLLEGLASRDPDRALDLYVERISAGEEVSAFAPLRVLTTKAGRGTSAFLDALLKMPSSPMGSTSTDMTFAEGFDFGRVAEALTELKKKDGGYRPAAFPSNFLEKWAVEDLDAAHGWWMGHGDVGHSGWSKFIDGIERTSGPAEAAQWAAGQLQDAGAKREKMIESISNSQPELLVSRVVPIADAMPDAASKDRFYMDVMKFNHWGDLLEHYDFAVTKLSSPEARLQAIEEINSVKYEDLSKTTDAQFQAWGITREEAKAAAERGRKKR